MAKVKEQKSVQNRIIYSRASYLYQAASYLAKQQSQNGQNASSKSSLKGQEHSVSAPTANERKALQNMSRQAATSLRAVTLKAQIRQSPAVKQTICKFCDTLQIEGDTCTSAVENASRGGRKPWADVLTIQCKTCGNVKRYPVSAPRQKRKNLRKLDCQYDAEDISNETKGHEPTPKPIPDQMPGP